ncbi:putative dehydrogenase [Terriglobus roseus DSM 18391]|uniref:Putative dehydrogenase n=1 Tax=Terriglobus roseus (strain DSM 18391 / NRRL B-41598 / KBS 63) TaxID=926566 RepID=I3ZCH2_TERRK|nr:Gfo/Idh/MocA family oxidoreductase [Terriglobus roseus]AFL86940.1 putative dehydrogenase [Terriglobus roseus DSM 18391]
MRLASWFKRPPTVPPAGRFRFAVVGLGHIAGYFLDALRDSPTTSITALVSGDAGKAATLAKKYSVANTYAYADFDRIADNPAIDAVYLALPVSQHRDFTERAAAAGKHILCEKPMAPTSDDARAMIAACATANVQLSIAYRCPHSFAHRRLQHLVRSGVLGANLRIESGFGFKLDPGWRDQPALAGGGSLYDVGIYPLNAARFLLGEDPSGVEAASAVCDGNGLERSIQWTSVFPSGARALCRSSYTEKIPDTLRVTGDNGTLLLAPAFSHRERYRILGEFRDATIGRKVNIDDRTPNTELSEFRMEAEQLAAAVLKNAPLLTPGEDGLADMIAMEEIYVAAGVPTP